MLLVYENGAYRNIRPDDTPMLLQGPLNTVQAISLQPGSVVLDGAGGQWVYQGKAK